MNPDQKINIKRLYQLKFVCGGISTFYRDLRHDGVAGVLWRLNWFYGFRHFHLWSNK